MSEDAVELRRFVSDGDEDAFRSLVRRHFDLVYGTALRVTNGDASLAEDVAQTVFTDLVRKARLLARHRVLTGWLHQATRFAAAKAVRSEQRRRVREQQALDMQNLSPESSPEWKQLCPLLDAALGKLNLKEREAILLHYFEQKNFRTVGAALGLSDDAAQKRVSRAVDKLRTILSRGGMAVSGSSLSTLLSAGGAVPAPAGLAAAVAKSSLTQAAVGPAGWTTVLVQQLACSKFKLAAVMLLVLLLGTGVTYLVHAAHPVGSQAFVTIDLSAHLNGDLSQSWTPVYGNNDLAGLGAGLHTLKQVPFLVQGVVQLQGAEWKRRGYHFPEAEERIQVGAIAHRLHLLHANSAFLDPAGTTVATLVLHYAGGDEARFPIRQGIETLDWWDWPHASMRRPTGTNTLLAWTGSNPPAEHQGALVRLFDTAFVNPHPEKEIRTVDFVSAMAGSAPFMVALTIER